MSVLKRLAATMLLCVILSVSISAQVLFTHTSNADFWKGQYNDMLISDNVSLPYQATAVNSWLTTTVLPQTLSGHGLASWNNRYVYVTGGYNGVSYSAAVYRATINTSGISSWTTLASMPAALSEHAVVIGNNTLYIIGGRNSSTPVSTIYHAAINSDGSIGSWQTSAVSLPAARCGHTAVYCNGYIYVAGGAGDTTSTAAVNTVYYAKVLADNTLSSFSTTTSLPAARNGHSMVRDNDDIYVLGGFANGGADVSTVYKATSGADGTLSVWSAETALPVNVSRHSSAVINGIITVLAGEAGGTATKSVYFANIKSSPLVWNAGSDMYDYTMNGAAFSANGQILYCGGDNLSGTPTQNSRYAPLTLSANRKLSGQFISTTFTELGAKRLVSSLVYNEILGAGSDILVSYRTADDDNIWSNWSVTSSSSPVIVNDSARYLQYKVTFTSTGAGNATLSDLSLSTPGTQLTGNLNAVTTFTKASSPYWVTGNISFTAGTHTFQAGTVLIFLPGTNMEVGAANLICNGISGDSVVFTGYLDEPGMWDGIYFNSSSDEGVSSQFYYTVISNAGTGSIAANLYCNSTSEPYLNHCNIRKSSTNGLRLVSAHLQIENTSTHHNGSNGLSLTTSSPTMINSLIHNNGAAGVYLTSTASIPNYTTTTISGNLYGIHYESPNYTFYEPNGSPALTGNTYNGICINGGTITTTSKVWNHVSYDYIILGDVVIANNPAVRLTIEPGNIIKGETGAGIQVAGDYNGGELYAIGTSAQPITFTSWNGNPGGWDGIFFHNNSDAYSSTTSVLDYCAIEKGSAYNIYADGTYFQLKNSSVQYASQDGIRFNNARGLVQNCYIRNNGNYGIWMNTALAPEINTCQLLNNGSYPIYIANPNSQEVLINNTYSGNTPDFIAYAGGNITVNKLFHNNGIHYHILNDLQIGNYYTETHISLAIDPGCTLEFNSGKKLQVGYYSGGQYTGNLSVTGNADSLVTFKAYNNAPGGWEGIYFHDYSDMSGAASSLKYCVIEQGNTYNIYCDATNTPVLENCIIRNALNDGLRLNGATIQYKNCSFLNNGAYPVQLMNVSARIIPDNNTYSANTLNYIGLSGGSYTGNLYLYNEGIPYYILNDFQWGNYAYDPHITLEIQAGCTLLFNPGKKFQVGYYSGGAYTGNVLATGTADSLITFKAYNNTPGGWEGIYFYDYSDMNGAVTSLQYCVIEQGNNYNIFCESTNTPVIENCTIRNAINDGLRLSTANIQYKNCSFANNGAYPVQFMNVNARIIPDNNTYTGNTLNYIALSGGTYGGSFLLYNEGIPYHILNDFIFGNYAYDPHIILGIQAGCHLLFNPGKKLQVGYYSGGAYTGNVSATGTADSLITFKAYNNTPGGWEGIYFHDYSDLNGAASSLKYCVIEQGNNYNILCESTNTPALEDCYIHHSLDQGLRLYNSSPAAIHNTTITNHPGIGIYLDGTSAPVIGNDTSFTNNIYNNGGYEIYNNSTSNIQARYNFWGTSDSAMITNLIYDRFDNPAKGIVFFMDAAAIPTLPADSTLMDGVVLYANAIDSPMKNALMEIENFAGVVQATTNTNTTGAYAFNNIPSGIYKMNITPYDDWGGGNATDALMILNHFSHLDTLEGMKKAAADVNASSTINGTDAMYVMRRYSALIDSFPAGDYLYHTDSLFVNQQHITNNIRMICLGDVNASYEPTGAKSSSVDLIYEGVTNISSGVEFDLPVRLKTGMSAGAVSLGFLFPDNYLEILGVTMANGSTNVYWSAQNGLLLMAWCSTSPMIINNNEVVLTIRMKAKNLSGMSNGILLAVFPHSEFAYPDAQPAQGVMIAVPEIHSLTTLANELNTGNFSVDVYPNPIKEQASIEFYLEKQSLVTIDLTDIMGRQIKTLTNTAYTEGKHVLNLDASYLSPGVYILRMICGRNSKSYSRMMRLVITE
ncbi:MAG TPA: right-handed parallel beta-helix repeat-containing protein [Bacteroidales bacterium]|nr:right-handed parallel beta-helix repeat-containing protein [Bacteroidales bacterium]